jgi:hypothetical protein
LKDNRRFGKTSASYSGSKNKPSKKPAWKQVVSRASGRHVPPKRRLIQRTTRLYIQEDSTLHDHRCENLILRIDKWRLYVCMPWPRFESVASAHRSAYQIADVIINNYEPARVSWNMSPIKTSSFINLVLEICCMPSHIKTLLITSSLPGAMACLYDRCSAIYQMSEFRISFILKCNNQIGICSFN